MLFKKDKVISGVADVNSKVDFTLLDPRATLSDLEKLCDVAYKNQYYSVCVNPCNVSYVSGYIANNLNSAIKVVSVVGFPLGANTTESKIFELKQAIQNGADEIDVVINIGKVKSGDFVYVKDELTKIRKAMKKHTLKVIIETCYLDENEIIKICKICASTKIDFVKTSTGFGTGGAFPEHVSLMQRVLAGKCKIKASGGVRTREQAVNLINLGADRIGTSHII